jgi:hypothetical protein
MEGSDGDLGASGRGGAIRPVGRGGRDPEDDAVAMRDLE